ncbi:DMT family transporter [Myxococcota bacterium]|nr:DMT family transporter [Myxococcota bacterium]
MASAVGAALMAIPWKLANEAGDPSHAALLLLATAALVNSAFVFGQRLISGGTKFRLGRLELGVALLLAIFTLAGNLASAHAIQELSPSLLNVLLRAEIIFVAIFGWLLLGERVEGRFWLGAVVAVIGLIVLQGGSVETDLDELLESGAFLAIVAAASFSFLAIVTRHFIHRIDPVSVNAIRLWLAVGIWFPIQPLPNFSDFPVDQILYATLAAIAGPFLGRLALMNSARYIEARITSLVALTTPVMTLVVAFLLLSDWPRPNELIGGAIMVSGIAIPLVTWRPLSTSSASTTTR